MKRLAIVCLVLLVAGFVLSADVLAQAVNLKVEPMSPGRRSVVPAAYSAPSTVNNVATGLRVVGTGMRVYLSADTTGSGTTTVSTFAWSFVSKPTSSTAAFVRTDTIFTSFIADLAGQYIVQVTVNGTVSDVDTIRASSYVGVGNGTGACGAGCHAANMTAWAATPHALVFKEGITGNLENDPAHDNKGAYTASCIKCHTTGWEPTASNGNFGALAKQSGWDTTWYKGLQLDGDYWIPKDTMALWDALSAAQKNVATIGCESCHGPGGDHMTGAYLMKKGIGKSLDAGVCTQCHDAPKKHRLGSYWAASKHGILAEGGHTSQNSCYPCHSGAAFVKFVANRLSPGYAGAADGNVPISCSVCHDPHGNSNPNQLRTVAVDSLMNGYVPTLGGKGQLCMNCHRGRYSVNAKITATAPYYGWGDRFYNHYSVQADMMFGQNGYQYSGTVASTQSVHLTTTANSCVTCHMQTRTNGSSIHSNHEMTMDSLGVDFVGVCTQCHAEVTTSFSQKMAKSDLDGDGTIEPFVTEVDGLLEKLKAKLPIDPSTGEPVNMKKDSLTVKNRPELIQGIWNYYYVKNDFSHGVHNPTYTVALLNASIGAITGVERVDQTVPATFALGQNYPNPFNPTTEIGFSVPQRSTVVLEVFDMLGKHVSTLVNDVKDAGSYRATWSGLDKNGDRVASGIYIYRLQAGTYTASKKMVLLK